MKKTHTLIASALVAGLLLSNTACEVEVAAETTEKYLGPSSTQDIEWTSGQDLAVDSRNGNVNLEIGESGSVIVLFEPFTFRGQDEEAEALAEMDTSLVKSVGLNESGDVFVYTQKDGPGSSSLGADMTIRIPPEFDAGIFIEQDGSGDVHIDGVGEAIEIGVLAQGVSDCFIHGAPTVVNTRAWCGAVLVDNVSGHIDVQADFLNGNASVHMASVEPAGGDNIIYTEDGDIVLTLPADEGYNVQAWVVEGGGVVNTGNIPSDCEEVVAAEGSKTVSCGEGPTFDLQAGLDVVGDPVNIELRYE
jgi:hypothetical protein